MVLAARRGDRSAVIYGSLFEPDGGPALRDRVAGVARSCRAWPSVVAGAWASSTWPTGSGPSATSSGPPCPRGPVAFITHSGSVFSAVLRTRRHLGFTVVVSAGQELVTTAGSLPRLRPRPPRDPGGRTAARDPPGARGAAGGVGSGRRPGRRRRGPDRRLVGGRAGHGGGPLGRAGRRRRGLGGPVRGPRGRPGGRPRRDGRHPRALGRRAAGGGRRAPRRRHRHGARLGSRAGAGGRRGRVGRCALRRHRGRHPGPAGRAARSGTGGGQPAGRLGDGIGHRGAVRRLPRRHGRGPAGGRGGPGRRPGRGVRRGRQLPQCRAAAPRRPPSSRWSCCPTWAAPSTAPPPCASGPAGCRCSRAPGRACWPWVTCWSWRSAPPVVPARRPRTWTCRWTGPGRSAGWPDWPARRCAAPRRWPCWPSTASRSSRPAPAASPSEAVAAAAEVGYPVVVKTDEPSIAHKSDVGGVILGLDDAAGVASAYAGLARRLGPRVLVAATAPDGVELALGLVRDPDLGPLRGRRSGRRPGGGPGRPGGAAAPARSRTGPGVAGPALDLARCSTACGAGRRPTGPRQPRRWWRLGVLAVELGDALDALDVNPLRCGPGGCWALDALVEPRRPGGAAGGPVGPPPRQPRASEAPVRR